MKLTFTNFSLAAFLLATCFTLLSCDNGDGQSIEEETRELLIAHPWKSTNVVVDGVNQNSLFQNFTLTFTPTSYSSNNGEPVWITSGTWNFIDGSAKSFTRNDNVVVTIESITETTLKLSLQWNETTLGNGRINSVKGKHIFDFSK